MHRTRTTLIALLILAAGLAGTILTSTSLAGMHDQIVLQEVLYLPSAKTVKALSFGYTGLMADVYWTRVVQYYGRRHMAEAQTYKLLPPLLDITTALDPHLDIAYEFGAFFLSQKPPQGAGEPDEGIALVRKGIENNPTHWRLYYDLGFIYWMEKKDFKSAADAFAAGAKVPGAMPWMWALAGSMAQGADNLEMARTLWNDVLQDSKDPLIRSNANQRLACIDSDEAVIQIQKRVDFFRERVGRYPSSLAELVNAGLLRGVPTDPAGGAYEVDSNGDVVVAEADRKKLPFITRGLPRGTEASVLFNRYAIEEKAKQIMEEMKKKEEEQKSSGQQSRPN